MNEELNDPVDAAIDRAARQLVEQDPPQRLYSAVMTEVRRGDRPRRQPWFRWSLLAASAAALLLVAIAVWNQPREAADRVASRVEAPATEPSPAVEPQAPSPAVPQVRPRRLLVRSVADSPEPVVSELTELVAPIDVPDVFVTPVPVVSIAIDALGVEPIPISQIDIDSR